MPNQIHLYHWAIQLRRYIVLSIALGPLSWTLLLRVTENSLMRSFLSQPGVEMFRFR